MLGLKLQLVLEVRLNHAALGVRDLRERVFLTKKRGESLDHVLMKFLSWLLFYHPELRIEVEADQHYKPDLVRFDERGAPLQWVDCGQTALKKLDRIASKNRKTLIDIVKPTERELRLFKDAADSKIARPERVRYFAFRDGFLNELAERVHGRHQVEATVVGDAEGLELVIDGVAISSPVVRL
ncbi:MAG: YaeQ family protein [Myxococcales bacterium]